MDRLERITGTSKELTRVQEKVTSAFERNKGPGFDGGREIEFRFDVAGGTVSVRKIHGLGRKPKGFFVTDALTDNVLEPWSLIRVTGNVSAKHEIELQILVAGGTGNYAFKVWVY